MSENMCGCGCGRTLTTCRELAENLYDKARGICPNCGVDVGNQAKLDRNPSGWCDACIMSTRKRRGESRKGVPALPAGWRVENLGLIGGVQFTGPSGHSLLWCDGEWFVGNRGMAAPGVPMAKTMAQARRVGAAFIRECEEITDP